MTKKEKVLYWNHGRKWDVIVKYIVTLSRDDTINILKCHEKMIDLNCAILKRVTKRIHLFKTNIYFNKLYGGIDI